MPPLHQDLVEKADPSSSIRHQIDLLAQSEVVIYAL
jgi:hypothetical protein